MSSVVENQLWFISKGFITLLYDSVVSTKYDSVVSTKYDSVASAKYDSVAYLLNTRSPRATIAHLRVNKYSHWIKCFLLLFF